MARAYCTRLNTTRVVYCEIWRVKENRVMKSGLVILETQVQISIRPNEILPVSDIVTVFIDRADLDTEAKIILGYCQKRGDWNPFTMESLAHYASGQGLSNLEVSKIFSVLPEWSSLCQEGWIVQFRTHYFITKEFVQYLWNRYPVNHLVFNE